MKSISYTHFEEIQRTIVLFASNNTEYRHLSIAPECFSTALTISRYLSRARIIAEGDLVCIRMTVTGTHKGEHRGMVPTGQKIKVRSVQIHRIVDGKVVEGWTDFFYIDQLDFMKKEGVIEYTEIGKKLFPEDAK